MAPLDLRQKSGISLGWDEMISLLVEEARSPITAERLRSLPILDRVEAVQERLALVWEGVTILKGSGDFPLSLFADFRPLFIRAAKGALLEGGELRAVFNFLDQVEAVRSFFMARAGTAPRLHRWGAELETLEPLRKRLEPAIDEEGSVRDSATPALQRLTAEAARAREAIVERLEEALRSPRYEKLLQERYYTQREERYVLPFKIAHRHKEGVVVHDLSASGATAFVEPKELVEPNNRLRMAQLAVAHEVQRILRTLSEEVGREGAPLARDLEILAELDLIRVQAKWSARIGATCPAVRSEGRMRLLGARHPLLLLHKEGVVSNDILLEEGERAMILSGPNAGGKTVLLKTVGLLALMVRAGLPIPCREGSEIPLFPEVLADIGDAQDLAQDLSSFSAHLQNLTFILASAPPGALILLDEVGASTDPTEGAALAEAILIEMVDRGLNVVTTTHYPALKGLPQTDPRFLNASLSFDLERLAPTYRLIRGVPGRSAALEIAARLGLSKKILDRARRGLHPKEAAMERLIAELEEERRKAEEARRGMEALREEMERGAAAQKDAAAKLAEAVASARSEIAEALRRVRASQEAAEIKKGEEALARIRSRVEEASVRSPVSKIAPQVGKPVEILSLGTRGILLDPPEGRKKVRVQVGGQIVQAPSDALAGLPEGDAEQSEPPQKFLKPAERFEPVIDLHGMRVEEALESLERFLDRAALSDEREVRVNHGHGSGRLKKAVRAYLGGSPYVARFRPGDLFEGGDGVTLVTLR